MFAAVDGLSAGKRTDDGVAKTGDDLVHRIDDVERERGERRAFP